MSEGMALVGSVAAAELGLAAFALLPPVPVLVVLGFAVGVLAGPINPVAALVIQHRTPDHMRGRVIGSYTSLAVAAGPLGLLAIGQVVDAGGPGAGYLVIGAGCLLAAAFALTGRSHLGPPAPDRVEAAR
jgi:MFS family permease